MFCKIFLYSILVLMFSLSSTMSIGIDIAIYNNPIGWNKANADVQLNELVGALDGKVDNVTLFTAGQEADVKTWVENHMKIPEGHHILILTGNVPDPIYPGGNVEPDGSLAEEFLDEGNTIFNIGEYIFFQSTGAKNNAQGFHNIVDMPGVGLNAGDWNVVNGNCPMTVTADGEKYTPSLEDFHFNRERPFPADTFVGAPWKLEIALAENTKDAPVRVVDPAVIVNTETEGRVGIFYNMPDATNAPAGAVVSEFILNYYLKEVVGKIAVQPSDKLAATWGSIRIQ